MPTGAPTATAIGMLGGSAQLVAISSALPVPLQVHVTDQYANPIAGATVTFAGTGGATVGSATVTTDASGNAQTTATLGTRAGLDSVTAMIAGDPVPVVFLETALPGPAASIAIVSGNNLTGTTGVAQDTLVVVVKDVIGNAIAGDSVTWTTTAGTLSVPSSTTVFGGTAQVTFTPALGANTVTATLNGTALAAIFTETGN
jgi:adhesin/invasin